MKVLHLITARSGSKGVPHKNIREIKGIPLLGYKVISAKKSSFDSRIILSTDSPEYAAIGEKYGAEIPFLRPSELAQDQTSSIDVAVHAVQWLQANLQEEYDFVSLLEPSSPFATYKDLDAAIQLLIDNHADSVIGMIEAKTNKVFIDELDNEGRLSNFYRNIFGLKSVRRQDLQKQYTFSGALYIVKTKYLLEQNKILSENSLPYIMQLEYGIEIDDEVDLLFAQSLVDTGKVDIRYWR